METERLQVSTWRTAINSIQRNLAKAAKVRVPKIGTNFFLHVVYMVDTL